MLIIRFSVASSAFNLSDVRLEFAAYRYTLLYVSIVEKTRINIKFAHFREISTDYTFTFYINLISSTMKKKEATVLAFLARHYLMKTDSDFGISVSV